jgi:3D (Asp-Asp-Asp) domain-containing protein
VVSLLLRRLGARFGSLLVVSGELSTLMSGARSRKCSGLRAVGARRGRAGRQTGPAGGIRLLAALALLAAQVSSAPASAPAASKFRVSLYYVALEGDYPVSREGAFRDARGRALYRASPAFVAAASVEGSARTASGRSLMFDPQHPREGWAWSAEPFGVDARDCPLLPYRTAATPPWIPLGARLYIPETVGLLLPGGRRHDGYWYATDRGVGIEGDRIDLFMRFGKASMRAGEQFGLDYLKPVHVRLIGRLRGCPKG